MNDEKANQTSFVGHLTELRSRLIKSIIYLFIFFVISYTFAENIYNFLVQPYADAVKDDEVNSAMEKIVTAMKKQLSANLRD